MSSQEEREVIYARGRELDSEVASIFGAARQIESDGIDRGNVSFSLWGIFNPKTYEKLEKYLSDCRNNRLPMTPLGLSDEIPTIPAFYHQRRENTADLNYFEPTIFRAAEHYVRHHQENYQEYQNSQERLKKKRERTNDNDAKLDTKKQKGSSTKRISRKQRKVSKQQKRNSRT